MRYAYHHSNGATYYSLYQNGKWRGYVNAEAMTLAATSRGAALAVHRVVTVTKPLYTIWHDLTMRAAQTDTTAAIHQTYVATQRFVAEYGAAYYLLATDRGQPVGYVNAEAVTVATGRQGFPAEDSREVLLKAGYTLWQNFAWRPRAKQASGYSRQILEVRRDYTHLNGSRYASVYTKSGQWCGYVNVNGLTPAGEWRPNNGQLRYYDNLKGRDTKSYTVTYFSQLDSRWAHQTYGGYAFGPSGCGMTALAMVLAGYGRAVTPVTTASYGFEHAEFNHDGAGTCQSTLVTVASRFGLDWRVMTSASELTSYLKQGYPATVCLDLGGYRHIVVLHGYAAGKTTVADPYANRLFSGQHTVAEIWGKLSWLQGNREMGASAAVVYFAR